MDAERCVICGSIIPEGQQVCTSCIEKSEMPDEETADQLKDIADVLSITANTDTNIRRSMEAILRIAAKLERKRT